MGDDDAVAASLSNRWDDCSMIEEGGSRGSKLWLLGVDMGGLGR